MSLPEPFLSGTRIIPLKIKGRVWKFGDNINTESMMPTAAHYAGYGEDRLKRGILEFYDPEFGPNFKEGDIIVAGTNFGCSSSRAAAFYLKRYGIDCIITESTSQIFYRNAWAFGLPVLESPNITKEVDKGDILEVDIQTGTIYNETKNKTLRAIPPPQILIDIVKAGDMYRYLKSKGEL